MIDNTDQCVIFFFNDTATTEIYTLSLHDALPISLLKMPIINMLTETVKYIKDKYGSDATVGLLATTGTVKSKVYHDEAEDRSEEHTSELQSRQYLVCRLLLEKKNTLILNHRSVRQ